MFGLLILFSVVAALLSLGGAAGALYALYHPPRKTLAYALAHHMPTDPGELGLHFVDTTYRMADGAVTPGWVIEGQATAGPTVIVSHGWGECRFDALERLEPLPQLVRRIILYDLRAHGESTARNSRYGTLEARDVLAIVDQAGVGEGPIVLMGYGMGAGVSIAAAAARNSGGGIAGVIAVNAPRDCRTSIAAWLRAHEVPVYPLVWLITAHLGFWLEAPAQYDRALLAARMKCPLLLLNEERVPGVLVIPRDRGRPGPEQPGAEHGTRLAAVEVVGFPALRGLDLARSDPDRYLDVLRRFFSAIT